MKVPSAGVVLESVVKGRRRPREGRVREDEVRDCTSRRRLHRGKSIRGRPGSVFMVRSVGVVGGHDHVERHCKHLGE